MTDTHFLPAEWYPQSGIQLTWPHENTDWDYILEEVTECYINLAREISSREMLLIVTPQVDLVRSLLEGKVNMNRVTFVQCDTNDTWARDHGPITTVKDGKPVINDFKFNGWGLKFAADKDNLITSKCFYDGTFNGEYVNHLNFVLEGGAIESDGEGTVLTTSECLLSKNRNGGSTKAEIEQYLKDVFNLKQVLWVDHGYLAGDDTDSHIDTLARLCPGNVIAYVKCKDTTDEHYESLKAMENQLKELRTLGGEPYKLIALPMSEPVYFEGERLPATYANFLIMNGAVLYPTYSQPVNDAAAFNALTEAFPGYEIVGVNCEALIKQHGSLPCVTMQFPKDTLAKELKLWQD